MQSVNEGSTVFIKCVDTGKTHPVSLIRKEILSMTVRLPPQQGLDKELVFNLYRKNRESKYYVGKKFGMEFSYDAF
jgi:hypothetical protein